MYFIDRGKCVLSKSSNKQDSSFRILTVLVLFRTQGHALPLSVKNACHSWAAIKEAKGMMMV